MDNPRRLALDSLIKAETSASYSNLEVNAVLSKANLEKVDAALYTALYLGVTEKIITLDYLITKYSAMHIKELDTETKNALRLGFYQLLYMDKIPDYSAVNETVSLCSKRSKGFVNACLRGFVRCGKRLDLPSEKWERISVEYSIPMSLLNIFKESYGEEIAERLATSCEPRKGVTVRINTLKIKPREIRSLLRSRRIYYSPVDFTEEMLIIEAPISDFIDLIDKGLVFVQDVASLACVKILAPKPSEKLLDACACPGGKSFSSAIEMKNEGSIVSCDLHKNKLSLVKNGASKLGIKIIETKEQDAKLANEEFFGEFDKVLCDVPCSGLGVMYKKPDIKYKPIEQIYNLPSIQLEIIKNCSRYVKPGGELVYSTCTLNKEENERVVSKFLSSNSSFEAVDFKISDKIASKDGTFTFMPYELGTDEFFVAKMKRVK